MASIPTQPATTGTDHPQRVLDPKAKLRLQRAVKEFESVMVGYMLKSMRSSIPKDDMGGESYGGDMLEGMFDGELARYVSRGSSLGLGEMLYKEITGEEMPRMNPAGSSMPRFAAPDVRVAVPPVTPLVPRPAIATAVAQPSPMASPSGEDRPGMSGPAAGDPVPAHAGPRNTVVLSPATGGTVVAPASEPVPRLVMSAGGGPAPAAPGARPVREQGQPGEIPQHGKRGEARIAPATVAAPSDTVRRRLEALDPIIRTAADTSGVQANLLKAVIATESGGRTQAQSHRNAKGLMQLIDSTATAMGVRNVWDPLQNVQGGARYLGQMMDRFGGNIEHALASYNAGPGAVEKHNGVPPYRETQQYVGKVLEYLRYFEQQEGGSDDQD